MAYSIAIPSHRKALERKATRLLAISAQKRATKRKRYFARRHKAVPWAAMRARNQAWLAENHSRRP